MTDRAALPPAILAHRRRLVDRRRTLAITLQNRGADGADRTIDPENALLELERIDAHLRRIAILADVYARDPARYQTAADVAVQAMAADQDAMQREQAAAAERYAAEYAALEATARSAAIRAIERIARPATDADLARLVHRRLEPYRGLPPDAGYGDSLPACSLALAELPPAVAHCIPLTPFWDMQPQPIKSGNTLTLADRTPAPDRPALVQQLIQFVRAFR
jgi:hypothetical protein